MDLTDFLGKFLGNFLGNPDKSQTHELIYFTQNHHHNSRIQVLLPLAIYHSLMIKNIQWLHPKNSAIGSHLLEFQLQRVNVLLVEIFQEVAE